MKSFSELTSASFVSNSDILAISQENSGTYSSKKTTVKEVSDFANQNFAEEYDSTSSYAVGDYCIYESVLYKCIGTTTGAFDSTKWTSVVVTDEMGSGGGGTGGHTIIDENGNSMTARAGLQFVGGANVSDDSTNNKTIVDLASAGGIDGVFIDTGNVIYTISDGNDSFKEWIATDDCYIIGTIKSSQSPVVQIDGITVAYIVSTSETIGVCVLAKKGQSVKYRMSAQSTLTAYGIQTGTTHSKFQPVIYSTEEREIGVWTDGKPLYEKTFIYSNIASLITSMTFQTDLSNVDYSQISDGAIIEGAVTYKLPYVGNNKGMGFVFNNSSNNFLSNGNDSFTNADLYITLQYTKSTDVAGSGSWTPQGVPTHHYSTDEQVIGTWIDGSTLYEKTFDLGSDLLVSTSSWTTLGITLDADKIVETKTTSTSGSFQGNILIYNDNGTWKGQTPRNGNDSSYVRYLTIVYTKSS